MADQETDPDEEPALPAREHALGDYLQALLDEVDEWGESGERRPGGASVGGVESAQEDHPKSRHKAQEQGSPAAVPPPAQKQQTVSAVSATQQRTAIPTPQSQQRLADPPRLPAVPMPQVAKESVPTPSVPPPPDPASSRAAPPCSDETELHTDPSVGQEKPSAGATVSAGGGGGGDSAPADPVPQWARPSFQALLFWVGGLRVAVPLVKLHQVVTWREDGDVEPTAGQPQWMHGLYDYRGRYLRVVDTEEFLLPQAHRAPPEQRRLGKLLVVGDGNWALACRRVSDVIRLSPEQVQWRSPQGRRPWLVGTVREHLCALIDAEALANLFERGGDVDSVLASTPRRGQNSRAG